MSVMRRCFHLAAIPAALLAANPIVAQTEQKTVLTAAVRQAVDRGEMLYIYDRAAWLGTDDFRDHHANLMSLAGGYVVTGDKQAELVFYDKSKSKAVYRATYADEKLSNNGPPVADRIELTPLEKRMIAAKERALEAFGDAKVGLCAKSSPNLAALPPARPDGPILVYMMTPQTDSKVYPLGGHFSVEIGPDGSAGKVRRYMNTCFEMSLRDVPEGGAPAAFFVTHLLDPTPTEIHVFTSIASKVPIMVGTKNKWIWAVEGNRVRTVDKLK
ncbi:MAG TPA: hypothetical protein VNJ05_09320 [Sphingomicrobium sp.]|nr:hypothetical protein [Sphingomicrobium sp.]